LKGVRIGYMGYLTLLTEEVISALDRFPQDLSTQITSLYAPQPEWEEYVKGRYSETKEKDAVALGGPRPNFSAPFSMSEGGGLGFDGEPGVSGYGAEAKVSFAGVSTDIGTGGGASGATRMKVDEAAVFSGLRLDETNPATFAPRTSVGSASSRIEIVQGNIEETGEEGGRMFNVGGVHRKADVPEDVKSFSRRIPGVQNNDAGEDDGSGNEYLQGGFRRVSFSGGSRSGRSVVAGIRNTAELASLDDEDEDEVEDGRTTRVSS